MPKEKIIKRHTKLNMLIPKHKETRGKRQRKCTKRPKRIHRTKKKMDANKSRKKKTKRKK
jgi:hypothetical protein